LYANVSNIILLREIQFQQVSLTFKFHIIAKVYFGHLWFITCDFTKLTNSIRYIRFKLSDDCRERRAENSRYRMSDLWDRSYA